MNANQPRRRNVEGPYLDLGLPERFALAFQTDDGSWMTEAIGFARQFDRLEDGSYIYSGGGSTLWPRFIEHHTDHFIHVDGGGDPFTYRILPPSGVNGWQPHAPGGHGIGFPWIPRYSRRVE